MVNKQIKEEIERLLRATNREGMENLIACMNEKGFFTSPGSTKYHGCYEGGLAAHSLNVYEAFDETIQLCSVEVPEDSIAIACLLHDLCKAGAYIGTAKPYVYSKSHPQGHAVLSIERIKKFIALTPLEENLIRYHMGVYGTREFSARSGEYTVLELTAVWEKEPAVKLMYFSDELATLVEKAEEK